jgi:bifunctional non-homologous end joining protein LigD
MRRSVKNLEVSNLAPQRPRFLREFSESPDYLLEPAWNGRRALIAVGPAPTATGYEGKPVDAPRELLDAIVAVTNADEALLDGIFVGGFLDEPDLEAGADDQEAFVRPAAPREVFVVVDLLEVDGESLLDVPLLERKRQLAAIVRASQNVRLTPFVRRGFRSWRDTLEAQGFKQFVVKKVNSRYRPGETNDDWLQVQKL